jgi:hypothetical protein
MNRFQHLLSLASAFAFAGTIVPAKAAATAPSSGSGSLPNAGLFRWVVPVLECRVGVLADVGTFVISTEHDSRPVLINVPRAGRGDIGWHEAKPPAAPYHTQARTVSDVITYAGPDIITVGAAINFEAVFGVRVPGAAAPNYLVRITPRSQSMQTFALPDDSHGPAIALYKAERQEQLTVVRQDGTTMTIGYPRTL